MPTGEPIWFEFVETLVFTKRLAAVASRATLLAIQAELLADPTRWPVVKGSHGVRKGRIADPTARRGKSGSYRYLYLFLPHVQRIYLLYIFAKHEQDELTAEQLKLLAQMSEQIRKEAK